VESEDLDNRVEITEEDVIGLLDIFTKVPALILRGIVAGNSNVVKSFEGQIIEYKSNLSDEEIAKIKLVLEMPVSELQEILHRSYMRTGKKQLKILSDQKAEPFIKKNLKQLEAILFN
jgi:hypothetical protein